MSVFSEFDLRRARAVYSTLPEYARRIHQVTDQAGAPGAQPDLTSYEYQLFSQNGEDGVLAEILRRTGAPTRCFVEFGVESGREGTCVALADVAGWEGLFLEADNSDHHLLAQKYRGNHKIRTLHAEVTPQRVNELFGYGHVPPEPDVISIDIDGSDYWVWHAMTHRPRVIVIEYNSALPHDEQLVQPPHTEPWSGTAYFGASLGALITLGEQKGYQLVHCEMAGTNAFFVRTDLAAPFLPPDQVQRRGPNYHLTSYGHPTDNTHRDYLTPNTTPVEDADLAVDDTEPVTVNHREPSVSQR